MKREYERLHKRYNQRRDKATKPTAVYTKPTAVVPTSDPKASAEFKKLTAKAEAGDSSVWVKLFGEM